MESTTEAQGDADATIETSAGSEEEERPPRRWTRIPVVIGIGLLAIVVVGGLLVWRAESNVDKVALASLPKPVTVIAAPDATFRDSRRYVGTLRPWVEASVGPQYISVYVDTTPTAFRVR